MEPFEAIVDIIIFKAEDIPYSIQIIIGAKAVRARASAELELAE
jgi:hypothetical protein